MQVKESGVEGYELEAEVNKGEIKFDGKIIFSLQIIPNSTIYGQKVHKSYQIERFK